jgi:hypothetical protein
LHDAPIAYGNTTGLVSGLTGPAPGVTLDQLVRVMPVFAAGAVSD